MVVGTDIGLGGQRVGLLERGAGVLLGWEVRVGEGPGGWMIVGLVVAVAGGRLAPLLRVLAREVLGRAADAHGLAAAAGSGVGAVAAGPDARPPARPRLGHVVAVAALVGHGGVHRFMALQRVAARESLPAEMADERLVLPVVPLVALQVLESHEAAGALVAAMAAAGRVGRDGSLERGRGRHCIAAIELPRRGESGMAGDGAVCDRLME